MANLLFWNDFAANGESYHIAVNRGGPWSEVVAHQHDFYELFLIHELRMERAAALLAAGRDSVAFVGREVGFQSLGAFYRAFKAYHGTPPTRFRSERGAAVFPGRQVGSHAKPSD